MAKMKAPRKKVAPKKAAIKKKEAPKTVDRFEEFLFKMEKHQWTVIETAEKAGAGVPPAFLSNVLLLQLVLEVRGIRKMIAKATKL